MAQRIDSFQSFFMAAILHVVLLGAMVAAFDFSRQVPFTPMAVQATLVQEVPDKAPPPKVEKTPDPIPEPIPDPVPEPVVDEPEPEPDNSDELRREAEAEKRRLDALLEQERLDKIKEQEKEDREKKEREEAERKKNEEIRKERERQEAERKREEDIQRQREENDRLRRELEAEQRDQEIEDEARRLAAVNSPEMSAYVHAVGQKIRRNWAVPASAGPETLCSVRVRQLPGGEVVGVTILSCNGDDAVKRSVEAAIRRSSPLPEPSNRDLFDPNLRLNLTLDRED